MTKKNLIIVIILLSVIDLVAAGWYMSRRIEASGMSQSLFDQRDSTENIAMADTIINASQADEFDDLQHNTYYFIADNPTVAGDNSTRYTSIKHVKTRWPKSINGDKELSELNKELISKAFSNTQAKMKDARYVYLNTPTFNKPMGDDYHKVTTAPKIVPTYGNVSQVLVYPYMTSQRMLVMEIDKVEYNGHSNIQNSMFVHYDRQNQRLLSRMDILVTDFEKENKLLKALNKKIDELNKNRGDNKLQHALNAPAEICCGKKGISFQFKQGTISPDPVEVFLDYEKMEPYLTKDFKRLLKDNEDFTIYDEKIKPEPINSTPKSATPAAAMAPAKKTKSHQYDNYGSGKYNNYKKHKRYKKSRKYRNNYNNSFKQKYTTPTRTKQKRYSGAKRKSGRYGYAGQRRSKHRRR